MWPLSDHINTDEAYSNYSEYRRDGASGELSFVNGLQNSDVNERMLALNPDGTGCKCKDITSLVSHLRFQPVSAILAHRRVVS